MATQSVSAWGDARERKGEDGAGCKSMNTSMQPDVRVAVAEADDGDAQGYLVGGIGEFL